MDACPGCRQLSPDLVAGHSRPVCRLADVASAGILFPTGRPDVCGHRQFLPSWDGLQAYAFLLFALICCLIYKLLVCKETYLTLIAPFWPQKEWFRELQSLAVAPPVPLPLRRDFSNSRISITCTRTSPCFALMLGNYTMLCPHSRSFEPGRHTAFTLLLLVFAAVVPTPLGVL